jgi:hypothetical protein
MTAGPAISPLEVLTSAGHELLRPVGTGDHLEPMLATRHDKAAGEVTREVRP